MKMLLLLLIGNSTLLFAQETDKRKLLVIPPNKILKHNNLLNLKDNSKPSDKNGVYKMLVTKPKNPDLYAALKVNEIDPSNYKILNALDFENLKEKSRKKIFDTNKNLKK